MPRNASRPLSPHLTIWRWGPHMLVSILHRATGVALATAGVIVFVWWLAALAAGPDAYATFTYWLIRAEPGDGLGLAANVLARVAAVGLSWAFFQHLCSGLRHLLLDTGAGYELRVNKKGAVATMIVSTVLTAIAWGYVVLGVQG